MTKITIERPYELVYQSITNNIYIDGEKIGTVTSGNDLQYEITPGRHTVVAKSKWGGNSKLKSVEVGSGECKTLRLTAVRFMIWVPVLLPLFIATLIYLISLIFDVDLQYMHLMFGSLGLYLVYFFTFGRSTYWKLREVKGSQ